MNLILWLIAGGIFGGFSAWGFSIFTNSHYIASGNITSGFLGSLLGGLFASKIVNDTPIINPKPKTFSPGGLSMATLGAIICLIVFNWLLR